MPVNDSWVAATAIANDLAVASQDSDWTVSPGFESYGSSSRTLGVDDDCRRTGYRPSTAVIALERTGSAMLIAPAVPTAMQ
ncbi:MAG: hypothetical protein ACRD6W_07885 [Nitrososphaerales archaeon]